jgi:hypothetical protein
VFLERRRCRRGEKLASRPPRGNNTRPREKLGDVYSKCEAAEDATLLGVGDSMAGAFVVRNKMW